MGETKTEIAEIKEKIDKGDKKKSKVSPIIIGCGIGCLVVLVVISVVFAVAGKLITSKFGAGFIKSAVLKGIESKTGVKVDTGNNGEAIKITDQKTGGVVSIGESKLPEGFPSDFPIYKNAKVTAAASEGISVKTRGFWVTMTTADDLSEVVKFYETNLTKNGWVAENTIKTAEGGSWDVSKGTLQGTVMISRGNTDTETGIVINISPKEESNPTPVSE